MNLASVMILTGIIAVMIVIVIHMWKNRGNPCCNCCKKDCPTRRTKEQGDNKGKLP